MINHEVINNASTMMLRNCTREEFQSAITDDRSDQFAKTFVAKANMQQIWDQCIGAYSADGELMGAIIVTISKRLPKIANLQLLHTFTQHRRKGVAAALVRNTYHQVAEEGAVYYRVSSEPEAVPFYTSLGIGFWGLQKSGCSLSIFRISGEIHEGVYDDNDPIIRKALYSGRKGSLASSLISSSQPSLF